MNDLPDYVKKAIDDLCDSLHKAEAEGYKVPEWLDMIWSFISVKSIKDGWKS